MKEIIEKLISLEQTISTMESCTGGYIANEITNIENASKVFSFSAVTYQTEYKIKMGVEKSIIDQYGVYSIETAKEMSRAISHFTNSDYGIGITGRMKKKFNSNDNPIVYGSIYVKGKDSYKTFQIEMTKENRRENKNLVEETIEKKLLEILGKD